MNSQTQHRRLFLHLLALLGCTLSVFVWQRAAAQRTPTEPATDAAAFYRQKRLPPGADEMPVERYLEAQARLRLMPQFATAEERFLPAQFALNQQPGLGVWTPLGPGNLGGRARALVINPANPNVMYAAAVAGGLWKTTNAGGTWRPLESLLPVLAVSTLALDPANPEVIYAGTGEGFFNPDALRGAGIFKSGDGGATWARLPGTETADFQYVNDLAVSTLDSRRVYAATRTGVWQSLDGGASWRQALRVAVPGGFATLGCTDVALRSDTSSDFIFAACVVDLISESSGSGLVYRNVDAAGAGNWNVVLTEPGMSRVSLALAPANQDVVYAVATYRTARSSDLNNNGLLAVYRSTNLGNPGTWTVQTRNDDPRKLNRLLLSDPRLAFAAECGLGASQLVHQGTYTNTVIVDPRDANRLWVGGAELFRSDDGGANWGLASYSWANRAAPQYIHASQHAIVFHPQYNGATNRTLFIAGDGGVFRTDDALASVATGPLAACDPNQSAVRWSAVNNDFVTTQFQHGAAFPNGAAYLGGAQGNGVLLGTDAGGANGWRELLSGEGGYTAVNPGDTKVLYAANTGLSIQKSTDGGVSFSRADAGLENDQALLIAPFIIDPSDPQRLWAGGRSLWRTENGAANWQAAFPRDGNSGFFSALAVAPTDSNYVLAASGGSVSRTRAGLSANSAAQWQSTFIRSGFLSWLAFDPQDKNSAYATFASFNAQANDRHVYRSRDGGATWSGIDGAGATGLPDLPVHCLVVDSNNSQRLYVGTDLGVFVTNDGGANWASENTGFASVPVEALAVTNANGVTTLFAFTRGRGAWRVTAGQAGVCRYELAPLSSSFNASGGAGSANVTTAAGCAWTAASNADWLMLTAGASGSGAGAVSFSAAANTSPNARTGTLTIAGRSFVVTQEGRRDIAPPVLAITTPASGPTFTTDRGVITISGTASDDTGVTQVSWSHDRGTGGTATGTTAWSFTVLGDSFFGRQGLLTGANQITVTARDAAGNAGRVLLTVISRPEAVISTVAGSGRTDSNAPLGDGGPARAATLNGPSNVAVDAAGNLYITDARNYRLRRVTPAGVISTLAGNGTAGFSGDGGPATAAQICPSTLAFYFAGAGIALDDAGNIYLADGCNHRVRRIAPDGVISTIAGSGPAGTSTGGFAGDGGAATAARLHTPRGLALDAAGNLFIADAGNHRIRRVNLNTGVISTVAGSNFSGFAGDGGPATAARLNRPEDVAVAGDGNLYIADTDNHRIRRVTADGIIRTAAGAGDAGSTNEDVAATAARLRYPIGVTVDAAGVFYLSEFSGGVRRVNTAGLIRTVVGGSSSSNPRFTGDGGAARDATVGAPMGLALDAAGNLYIADSGNNRIRRVSPFPVSDQTPPVITITAPATATVTTTDGQVPLAGAAADETGVAQVRWSNDRGGGGEASGTNDWTVTSTAINVNLVSVPGPPLFAGRNRLTVTAWDLAGNAGSASVEVNYAAEYAIFTVAGTGAAGASGDGGLATAAQLSAPQGLARDAAGNLYIADSGNHRLRRVAPDGTIRTVAGSGQIGASEQSGPALSVTLNRPTGVAVDAAGNLFIADTNNHRIRRVTPVGVSSVVAGNGTAGFSGDGGAAAAAQLRFPRGVAVDGAGNLYIADTDNHRIRRVSPAGVLSTIAGAGFGFSGDGGAAALARLNLPNSVAVDAAGNLLIADTGNFRLRKVAPNGIITTVAGSGETGFAGDNVDALAARLFSPTAVAADSAGNLVLADFVRRRFESDPFSKIRKISVGNGQISTLAGLRLRPGDNNGDGNAALIALPGEPRSIIVDPAGVIYFSDAAQHRVYKLVPRVPPLATLSAASFRAAPLAPESIAAAFGTELATATQVVRTLPLPTALAGTRVEVRDGFGVLRLAPLFFVSPGQVNYLLPAGTAPGPAVVTITNGNGAVALGTAALAAVAPGLFAANANGQGVASAVALRIRADGAQSFEAAARFEAAQNRFVPVAIDLGAETEQVFLILYGTGLRGRSALTAVRAEIGGLTAPVSFAGAQGDFAGLDQVNLGLPRSLVGRGLVDIALSVDGQTSNVVQVQIK